MTFHELVKTLYDRGCNLADVAVGRMMDEIEAETGIWPDWRAGRGYPPGKGNPFPRAAARHYAEGQGL